MRFGSTRVMQSQTGRASPRFSTGPAHPDYQAFCLGPGHGTGYQDQIIIEAKDFLEAMAGGKPRWPTFRDGMLVNRVIEAAWQSQEKRGWVNIDNV